MSDIELVVKIDKKLYNKMKTYQGLDDTYVAVKHGTPLDKIRAEIENHCGLVKENHCKYCSYCNSLMGVREILELFDKYKAESEVENDD